MNIILLGDTGLIGSIVRYRLGKDKRFKILLDNKPIRFFNSQFNYDLFGERIKQNEANIISAGIIKRFEKNLTSDDVVINMAAIEGNERCNLNPELALESNVYGTALLTHTLEKIGCKYIHFSSTEIHRPLGLATDKYSYIHEHSPIHPRTIYSKTKYVADHIVKHTLKEDKWVIIKPGFVYGEMPYDTYSFFKRIIERIYLKQYVGVKFDEKLTLPINKNFQRDFMYYTYLCDMIIHIIEHIDLCTGLEFFLSRNATKPFFSYLAIIEDIMKVKNIDEFIECDESKDVVRKHSPIASRFFKTFPGFKLNQGIFDDRSNLSYLYKSVTEYYNDNYIKRVIQKQL